jgi:hypothetical protein
MKCALFALVLASCNRAPAAAFDSGAGDPPSVCTKLGAPCTFAPGKLGSCVEVEQTSGASAFVCQSQH